MSRSSGSGRSPGRLAEAIVEVTRTILANPHFFPAKDLSEVKAWVKRLFPETSTERFDSYFAATVLRNDLPWGRRRFWVPPSDRFETRDSQATTIRTQGAFDPPQTP
jgi:hypothetical protein